MPGLGRLIRAAALDVGPLRRHREFRLLYVGQAVSFTGSMLTYVAIPYQVYALTGSTFVVGLLGFASLAPLLVTALIGGALADARDRRRPRSPRRRRAPAASSAFRGSSRAHRRTW